VATEWIVHSSKVVKEMFEKAFIANPYPTYHEWLERGRMFWSQDFFGGSWVLPHYKDNTELLRESDRLTTEKSGGLVAQFPPEYHAELRSLDEYLARWLAFIDPPKHLRIRRLLQKGFTPEVLNSFRPRVQAIVDDLLAQGMIAGRLDMINDFAYSLPVRVVCAMLGVPDRDHMTFVRWMDELAMFLGNASSTVEAARQAKNALDKLTNYFRELLPERRKHAGQDLISILVRAEEEGDVLSEDELYAQCVFFLFAGHETTSNLIGNGMLCLLRHSEQCELLRARPSLMAGFIEEALRYEGPMQYTFRMARRDFDLFGHSIKKGQVLVFLFGSANRDPDIFADPDTFDITRKKNTHLTFGYGLHHCIGAATARMEADIAFSTLLQRVQNICMLIDQPEWRDVFRFRGLKSLPIQFEAS
jgi:cytochrome P450